LDEAALRRLTRRIYLPLPDPASRKALLINILKKGSKYELTDEELMAYAKDIEGYSASDIMSLVKEAAMIPLREIPTEKLLQLKDMSEIRMVGINDLKQASKIVSPSVSKHTVEEFEKWRKEKGQTN
jgi:SpoVK/Ycf46/Vps4 family AAA+-type ATPase